MIRHRSSNRFASTLSLLLLLAAASSVGAADLPLQAFTATYELHKGKRFVATTEIRLVRSGERWHWNSLTQARGVYAWFTRKKPFHQTSFSQQHGRIRLHRIQLHDDRRKNPRETARFDWDQGRMEVSRKGKHKQARLDGEVYDYLSIHLLASAMQLRGQQRASIDFYRRGKLVESELRHLGRERVDIHDRTIEASLFEQRLAGSDTRIRYFYDPDNPLLPLRILTLQDDEKPATLTLRQVQRDDRD